MQRNATLNIRIPDTLKQHGCEVLKREGIGVTEAVRGLFEFMETNQRLPHELNEIATVADAKEKRQSLMNVVGCVAQEKVSREKK